MVSIYVYKEDKHIKGCNLGTTKTQTTAEGRLLILEIHVGKCFRAAVTRTLPFLVQKYVFLGDARMFPTYLKIVH